MKANKEKNFDCLKMKTDIQAQIFSETQDMSSLEILDYFNKNKSFPKKYPASKNILKNPIKGTYE
jgi:hypothetical protein